MFLKMVKELDNAGTKILREAVENEHMLRKITNFDFLLNDVFDGERKPINKRFLNKSVVVKLGKVLQSEFGIIDNFYGEAFGRMQSSGEVLENLVFSCGLDKRAPIIDFFIKNNRTGSLKFDCRLFYSSDISGNSQIYNQFIMLLAFYFFDKTPLYTKIHDLLDFDKKNLIKISSENFINNLILLFSIKCENNIIKDFNISPSTIEDRFLKSRIINKKWLYIGCEKYYPQKYVNAFWFHPELETNVWLKENKLILLTSYSNNNFENPRKLKDKVNEPEFIEFINGKLNDWLKLIVGSSNFGMEIYDTLKTKFLLSNI